MNTTNQVVNKEIPSILANRILTKEGKKGSTTCPTIELRDGVKLVRKGIRYKLVGEKDVINQYLANFSGN